ncbi:hypothetical protein EVA_16605 [gut metagenome]|uniref:Uncharacterized protein n=1 Tax=gut metagenome TaxID=749906 RepID=J9G0F5_9ZZZZ
MTDSSALMRRNILLPCSWAVPNRRLWPSASKWPKRTDTMNLI